MKHNALTIAQIVRVTGLACYTAFVVVQNVHRGRGIPPAARQGEANRHHRTHCPSRGTYAIA